MVSIVSVALSLRLLLMDVIHCHDYLAKYLNGQNHYWLARQSFSVGGSPDFPLR